MNKEVIVNIISLLLVLLIAFLVSALIFWIAGLNPLEALWSIFYGGFGRYVGISTTLTKTVPIMFIALATVIAFKAGLWNVGGEGQYYMGAIGATYVALYFDFPMIIHIPLMLIAAFLLSAIWGSIAGLLKTHLKVNEILSTLMMNFIAIWTAQYLCHSPWRDYGRTIAATAFIPDSARLPLLFEGYRIHLGLVLVLVAALLIYIFLKYTVFGQQLQLLGSSSVTARYGAVNLNRTIVLTMFISAGIAGLAGFSDVSGVFYNLQNGQYPMSPGYGFIGIGAAMLGNLEVRGTVFWSIFLAGLITGASFLKTTTGLHAHTVDFIIGLMILVMIARHVFKNSFEKLLDRRFAYGGK